jgi:malonyl-CoA O-methyltransferase
MDKEVIARNFSRCAHRYDNYADIQLRAALELLSHIDDCSFSKILEIGCGTGNFTSLLKERFTYADFKAIDISSGMIDVARGKDQNKGVEFIIGDAENILFQESFDLITSNACLQWLDSLDGSLIKYNDWLEGGGTLCFSIFGPQTFKELNAVIREAQVNRPIIAAGFIGEDKIKEMLRYNFKEIGFWESEYREVMPSFKYLLQKVKHTGVRGNGIERDGVFTSHLLRDLEKRYLDKFKEIRVTYQVFYFSAKKG